MLATDGYFFSGVLEVAGVVEKYDGGRSKHLPFPLGKGAASGAGGTANAPE